MTKWSEEIPDRDEKEDVVGGEEEMATRPERTQNEESNKSCTPLQGILRQEAQCNARVSIHRRENL